LHGITTNRDLLVRILREEEFVAGDIDTGYLVRHDPAELGAPLASHEARRRHAVAAALAGAEARRSAAKVLGGMPSGWRNNFSEPQRVSFVGHDGEIEISYRFDRTGRCVDVSDMTDLQVLSASSTKVVLSDGGVTRTYSVNQVGLHYYVDGPDGSSDLTYVERFKLPESQLEPGALVATLPGTVVRVEVAVGDHVSAGDILVAIEAMKMEHEVRASHGGVVASVAVAAGEQVESGRLLVVVDDETEPDS
jgi:propionyl-CoA carboxylase alpha chain